MRRVQVIMWDYGESDETVTDWINKKNAQSEKLGGVVASTKLFSGSNQYGKEFCYVIEFDFPNKG